MANPARVTPPGEDPTGGARSRPVPFFNEGSPPGEDGLELAAESGAVAAEEAAEEPIDFLELVRLAENQGSLYQRQVNQKSWSRSYRAFHNEHFAGSKYQSKEWKQRSKIFRPKTRSAVRKQLAAVASSLFGTVDALSCQPGDESNKEQRASAAIIQELVNYRTDRTSGRAAIPWFLICMGACLDGQIAGICFSKQYWKLEVQELVDPGTGEVSVRTLYDRPDVALYPPESVVIDPAADWTMPAQTAAYLILKNPMRLDQIREKQRDPRNPWNAVPEDQIRASKDNSKQEAAATRRAREQGLDRMDDTTNASEFEVLWVYECFFRAAGEDWCFFSLDHRHLLTDPKPVREVYPEQSGERPVVMGYASIESHRIFPMSPVESWQQLQQEANDLANLTLDTVKMGVSPLAKVVRGRQVDLDALSRRGPNWTVLVTKPEDVDFVQPPTVPASMANVMQRVDVDFDDQAGQFNSGTVQTNRQLNETVGGLKLLAGSANAVQEFDIRVWVETWVEPMLGQLVRLEQFYESDINILGVAGQRAKLMERFGVSEITNELLENQVTIRVNAGLGVGDPSQRLGKFASAAQVAMPLLQGTKEFQSGEWSIDAESVMDEIFGAVGYRDGGKRFIKHNPPQPNPMQEPMLKKLLAEIAKLQAEAENKKMTGVAALRKVEVEEKKVEAKLFGDILGDRRAARDQDMRAEDAEHSRRMAQGDQDMRRHEMAHGQATGMADRQFPPRTEGGAGGQSEGGGGLPPSSGEAPAPAPQDDSTLAMLAQIIGTPREREVEFIRDSNTGRITGAKVKDRPVS